MKNPELFHKTVGILVNAYLNDTLKGTDCARCAVGNLVSVNMGYRWVEENVFLNSFNKRIFASWGSSRNFASNPFFKKDQYKGESKRQIDSTGYTVNEIIKIEKSFMGIDEQGDRTFIGLMQVVDTLIKIHEGNVTERSEAKSLFQKELIAG